MAKKRLNIKDKTGLPVDYDISAENVTIDADGGKPLTQKLDEIAETEAQAVRSITFNGQSYNRDNGIINIGEQEQPNWNESNPNYRTYIRNKPTLLSQFTNDCGFVTSSQIPEGADLSTVFASVAYDPTTSRINFFGKGSNTVLAYLDAAPFIVDGMVENVTLDSSTNELVITFNTASGKSPIRVPLGSISGQGTVQSVKMNGGTPIQPVNGVIDLGTVITEHQSLSSYATKNYVNQAVQQAEQGETVVINSDGANIVDGQSDSILTAPSSRMVKEIYLNLQKLFDPVNGLAGIAFVGTRPTWQSVAIPTHTITLGTMSNVTASLNGTTINGSTSASEGEVTIKLTPSQGAMILTENISIKLGTEDVPFTTAADNGSTLVTFILAGDVTVAASASSGRNIIFTGSTGCSIGAAGVAIGQDLDTTITANEHFTLPESITVKIGNTNITHSYTRAQGNKTATLHIDAANITGDLVITCTAVEDNHAVLNLTNVGSGVTVNKANNAHVYAGDTITILPASGNKVTASATVGGNAATLTGDTYAGYSYTIGANDVSANGTTISITATASALQKFSIDLSGLVGVTSSNATTSILEGSPYSTTLSKTDSSASGSVIIGTCTMGNEDITPQSGSTISVSHVTGNITIAATVGEEPMKVHAWSTDGVSSMSVNDEVEDTIGDFNLVKTDDITIGKVRARGDNAHLTIKPQQDWTIVIKGLHKILGINTSAAYNSQQPFVRSCNDNNINTITTGYEGHNETTFGQFAVKIGSPTSDSNSSYVSESGTFAIKLFYNPPSGTSTKHQFKKGDADIGFTWKENCDLFIRYNNQAKSVTATLVHEENGEHTFEESDSATLDVNLTVNAIYAAYNGFSSLELYNYEMNENDIEELY